MSKTNVHNFWCFLLLFWTFSPFALSAEIALDSPYLFHAEDKQLPPADFNEVTQWMSLLKEASSVSLAGGDYWMVSPVMVNSRQTRWVVDASNSIVESVDYWLLGSDGSVQTAHSGYYAPYEFLFDYGRKVQLNIGTDYWLVTRLSSRYYSSAPELALTSEEVHQLTNDRVAMAILICLGGLLFIALYNILIYISIFDKAFLYYGLYVLAYFGGWALTFHLPAHLFNYHQLELHHLFFISLPIFNIMFYKHFLQLPSYSPRLWRLSQYLLVACILALPTSIWLLPYTAIIASVLIMLWIALAITCGNVCLMKGFAPARYFIMAFSCLLLPAVIILPGNMGITPDFIEHAEFATLLGGTVDALLLSLALANKLKLLSEERKAHIEELGIAWEKARLDGLTRVGNRYAFDEFMNSQLAFSNKVVNPMALVLLNVDNLKMVNDTLGHQEGDRLLQRLVQFLQATNIAQLKIYRISGDEFVVILPASSVTNLVNSLRELTAQVVAEGLKDCHFSFGIAMNTDVAEPHEWLRCADSRLYQSRMEKRRQEYADSRVGEIASF
ncbi:MULTISPECIES: diguanylate cyclase [Shewanella]|uniref:diguanylate cyclase n=1 Tax=Shewanella TaxID=22 RepID=UPI000648C520|nr:MULTISPECIES: diguanylate cyclase [Shewanella]MCT8866129.1 GGDEF domain-containing protein [Shewanella xiamenensis]NSM25142.1 diguanylate cyclase [Shewanella sp. ZOR0012]